jgi:CelD/BcsL family acetyltransferase involved in cellulose biosynthesis
MVCTNSHLWHTLSPPQANRSHRNASSPPNRNEPDDSEITGMKIDILPAAQLSADHVSAWSRLQRSDAALANPFFRPEFTQAIAAVREDVEVAVWYRGDEPVGFLPFERSGRNTGRPVGSHINESQGAIYQSGVAWYPEDVVRAAGLRAWQFDHLAAAQAPFAEYQFVLGESWFADLSQGFERYVASRQKSFRKKLGQKERKAAREWGDLRLAIEPANRRTLTTLLKWKADHCRRTHRPCNYGYNWVVRSFEVLLDQSTDDFAGLLFGLYFGDRLAAVEFHLRSGRVMHGIISGYDRNLSPCAPGILLSMRVAQTASSLGITRIDFGKGDEPYKEDLATACDAVAEGAVTSRPLHASVYRTWYRAKSRLRATRLRNLLWRARRGMISTQRFLESED